MVLDQEGVRHEQCVLDPYLVDVDESMLTDLYVDMVVIRRIDDEAVALQRQGELGLWPPMRGQEAAQIGSGRVLKAQDFAFTSYREQGVAHCRGVGATEMLRVWRGTAFSGWDPHEHGMATPQIIIGAQSLHATGFAMAAKAQGSTDVAITYFGDGATSEGDVNEAMVFAAAFDAPVVFFCQNNQYAISEPVGVQSKQPLALRPTGFGIPSIRVDGNDVLAVRAATAMAMDRARSGGGPSFIEAVTYRMGPHTTSDDPKRYRDSEEVAVWAERCPIKRLAAHLERIGAPMAHIAEEAQIRADSVAKELRAAITQMQDPEIMQVFDNVYAEPNARLARQRAEYAAFRESIVSEA
ncbi:pyruvate dehydrogenase (acetyl-transferring) E1 component subunit alpha [Humidisolicoccus flavus]